MKSLKTSFHSALTVALACGSVLAAVNTVEANPRKDATYSWKIKKDSWSASDERKYEEFIQGIGMSGCKSIDQCLEGPMNPYRATDPKGMKYFSDCADLPYVLRSYFAWKNNLPFSFQSDSKAAPGPTKPKKSDRRYSPWGNLVTKRTDVVAKSSSEFPNGIQMLNTLNGAISSAMFRHHPDADDAKLFTDLYSVRIHRDSVKPGTVIYDPNGHVAVVYLIETDGRVRFMDAHPDNSLTRGVYGKKFGRSRPHHGAGFKNWRPIQLVGATKDAEGTLIGGKVTAKRNKDLSDYGIEQYVGTSPDPKGSWSKGKFLIDGTEVEYNEYIRRALAIGNLKYHPLEELKNMVEGLCTDLQDRVMAVNVAVDRKIHKKDHPERLPYNIYGTDGEWEEYSSPSRDARLKTSFKEMRDQVEDFVKRYEARDPMIVYGGLNLRADLLKTYEAQSKACVISYPGSDSVMTAINLDDVSKRLYGLSFDPYHCIELRWGATSAQDLAKCGDSKTKLAWYEAEQRLRNQIDRTYDTRMDFSLADLRAKKPGSGVDQGPDVDVRGYLTSGR